MISKKRNTIFFFIYLIALSLTHLMLMVCGVAQLYSIADARYLLSKSVPEVKKFIKIPDGKEEAEVDYVDGISTMLGVVGGIVIANSIFVIGIIVFIAKHLGFLAFMQFFIATYGIVQIIFGGIFFLFIFVIAYSTSFSRYGDTDYVVVDISKSVIVILGIIITGLCILVGVLAILAARTLNTTSSGLCLKVTFIVVGILCSLVIFIICFAYFGAGSLELTRLRSLGCGSDSPLALQCSLGVTHIRDAFCGRSSLNKTCQNKYDEKYYLDLLIKSVSASINMFTFFLGYIGSIMLVFTIIALFGICCAPGQKDNYEANYVVSGESTTFSQLGPYSYSSMV